MHLSQITTIFAVEAFLVLITTVISTRLAAKIPTPEGKSAIQLRMMVINGLIIAAAFFYFLHVRASISHSIH